MEFHEAANIFPLDEEHIDELAEDIRKNGQQVPVEVFEGKIIDGRRRWTACEKMGITALTKEVNPSDPVAYVLSLNLHRRHLTPSQLSMVGARAREIYDRQAKERMIAGGGDKKSKAAKSGVENLPPPINDTGKARDQVGKAIGVSGKSIDYATKVLTKAVPEVVKAVDEGRMAVSTAAALTAEDPDAQRHAVEFDYRGRKKGRKYGPGPNGTSDVTKQDTDAEPPPGVRRGVGVDRANEAINCLMRIPKNDALRKRGFQIVTDWIKRNG